MPPLPERHGAPQVVGLAVAAALAALLLAAGLHLAVRRLGRRSPLLADLSRQAHRPTQATLLLLAVTGTVGVEDPVGRWVGPVRHGLLIGTIAAVGWLVGALAFVVEDAAVDRYRLDVADNRRARRIRTQVMVLRRVTVAVIAVVAVAAMLLTFRVARTAGASLLASAGILGVIAGLAAQTTLANLFAGMQIAFSDSLRLDDVIVVEQEWGRVEEITLSYVVLHLWDDRRLIFPTSYFTGTPFQNWTRTGSALLGTVELDVDWTVPVEELRAELRAVLESTELWDGRVSVLQVTDALGGVVRLRALVSAVDAPTSWDLRCLVRERLVGWLVRNAPHALPRTRAVLDGDAAPGGAQLDTGAPADLGAPVPAGEVAGTRVFGGDPEGQRRSAAMTAADPPDDRRP